MKLVAHAQDSTRAVQKAKCGWAAQEEQKHREAIHLVGNKTVISGNDVLFSTFRYRATSRMANQKAPPQGMSKKWCRGSNGPLGGERAGEQEGCARRQYCRRVKGCADKMERKSVRGCQDGTERSIELCHF